MPRRKPDRAANSAERVVPPGYEIVPYEPRFREPLLDLQSLLWGPHRAANRALLEWKYFQNPCAALTRVYLALHNGNVVAMRGIWTEWWEAGTPTQVFQIMSAGDVVIAPEHRHGGLYSELVRVMVAAADHAGVPYIFVLSAVPALRQALHRMRWRSLGPLPVLIGAGPQGIVRRLRRRMSLVLGRRWRFSSFPFDRLSRLRRRTGPGRELVGSMTARPAAMARLVKCIGHDGRIRQRRDESYFAWRYRNPSSAYCFLYLLVHDELKAYVVLQTPVHPPVRQVNIVDCESASPGAGGELLTAALDLGGLGPIQSWSSTIPGESREVLRDAGFFEWRGERESESFPTVIIRPGGAEPPDPPWLLSRLNVLEPSAWDLREIYSDGI